MIWLDLLINYFIFFYNICRCIDIIFEFAELFSINVCQDPFLLLSAPNRHFKLNIDLFHLLLINLSFTTSGSMLTSDSCVCNFIIDTIYQTFHNYSTMHYIIKLSNELFVS